MYTIKATYDGRLFKPLATEVLPSVEGEIPVAIIFLDDTNWKTLKQDQLEAAARMRALRDTMEPLDVSIKELVEEGRDS